MELIHVLNRGVDKRKIFMDDQDYYRFIHDLFEFNNENLSETTFHIFNKNNDVGRRNIKEERKPRKLIVNILAFCLMPNHYHLLVSPRVKNGISLFMKKINGGYTKYFNIKYKRSGALFQGKYKRIIIKNKAHFIHLPYYIHLNPLDLIAPEWREQELNNFTEAIKFLDSYRWSSHLDYLGKNNFSSITQRKFLLDFFRGREGYENSMKNWLKQLELDDIKEFILE